MDRRKLYGIAVKVLEEKDRKIIEIYEKLLEKINILPKNCDNFGLIHTDIHFYNKYIYKGELTFFDWDDSAYKHFISDLAIVIFYHFMYKDVLQEGINVQSRHILALLVEGYNRQNLLDISFLWKLNDFLLLRSIVIYILLVAAATSKSKNLILHSFIRKTRNFIINCVPFLDMSFVLDGFEK